MLLLQVSIVQTAPTTLPPSIPSIDWLWIHKRFKGWMVSLQAVLVQLIWARYHCSHWLAWDWIGKVDGIFRHCRYCLCHCWRRLHLRRGPSSQDLWLKKFTLPSKRVTARLALFLRCSTYRATKRWRQRQRHGQRQQNDARVRCSSDQSTCDCQNF